MSRAEEVLGPVAGLASWGPAKCGRLRLVLAAPDVELAVGSCNKASLDSNNWESETQCRQAGWLVVLVDLPFRVRLPPIYPYRMRVVPLVKHYPRSIPQGGVARL